MRCHPTALPVLMLACLLPLHVSAVRAADDKKQFTNGLSGTVHNAYPILGIMDKSYPLAGLGFVSKNVGAINALDAFSPMSFTGFVHVIPKRAQIILSELPPREAFFVSQQARWIEQGTVYTTDALYSNSDGGFDIGLQRYEGVGHGWGYGLRIDLPGPGRHFAQKMALLRHAAAIFDAVTSGLDDLPEGTPYAALSGDQQQQIETAYSLLADTLTLRDPEDLSKTRAGTRAANTLQMQRLQDGAVEAYFKAAFCLRAALVGGYRQMNVGSVATPLDRLHTGNLGINASWLRALAHSRENYTPPGLLFLTSWQNVWVRDAGQAGRLSVALAYQDKVPNPSEYAAISVSPADDTQTIFPFHSRWRWQVGGEIAFKSALDADHSYGAFVRYRPSKQWELGLLAGINGDHHGFVGLRVEYGVALGK